MYENSVNNDRNIFEIPALLPSPTRKSRTGKFKIIYLILNFLQSVFPRLHDKKVGISKF